MEIKLNSIKMKTPEVSTFCGLNLKHGTVIVGIVQSILAFMCLILSAAYAEHPHELLVMTDDSVVPELEILRTLLIIIAVASAVQCIFSILIIFGAGTNRPRLLLPWLFFNPVALLVYVVTILVAVTYHTGDTTAYFIIAHIIIGSIVCLITSYNVIAVHSFYKYLKSLNF